MCSVQNSEDELRAQDDQRVALLHHNIKNNS